MILPLHIFEERYKIMTHYCLSNKKPFGVVFIREGSEVGGGADIFDVGTTAHITKVDHLEDGRMNIATIGVSRFRIHAIDPSQEPYLVGMVEDFPLDEGDNRLMIEDQVHHLQPILATYLNILAQVTQTPVRVEQLPNDPITLAYLAAIVLQTSLIAKQFLLSVPTLLELLQHEQIILGKESQTLKLLTQHIPPWYNENPLLSPN
jgi:Lon protease-like protein